jgi:hypothetical protein
LRQRRRSRFGLCLNCGYDLRGSGDRCSECGAPVCRIIDKAIPPKTGYSFLRGSLCPFVDNRSIR